MISILIVTSVLSALYLFLILYFLVGWLRLKSKKEPGASVPQAALPFVSIVIPVRNESYNIKACLESVFSQNYPEDLYEVIVIDDYSTDPTLRLAREFERDRLLVLDLQQYLGNPGEYTPNKKKAIALGIKNAKGELIITTDGDCTRSENWLRSMVEFYTSHSYKLVTGPVMVRPAKTPFEWFQQLDVLTLLGITGGAIRNGVPLMCNGANLMYAKQTFHDVEGFKGNHDVPTGDDIFLMQKIESKYPGGIGFVKDYEATVFTRPEKGIGSFMSQRIRWVSKSKSYGTLGTKFILFYVYLFQWFIPACVAYLLMPEEWNWLPIAVAGGTKLLADWLFCIPVTHFFRKKVLLLLLPFVEVFHILYILLIGLAGLTGSYRWKDRTIK